MGWVLVLGFLAGLALGVKYHREIMSFIGTAEARVATWKQALTEGDRKKGESTNTQGLYDVTEEIRSMGAKDEVQGEGDRESTRRYDDATKAFVESGKVKEQADTTANISLEEKRELGEAEKVGKERAKEEDPAVRRDYAKPE
ncbi:MAG: hypothetical protein LC776_02055 [Acidobacteria bacterium]|nr:hypothetical protein [Acidobacteriota bacterium]